MKAIIKEYISDVISIAVFCMILSSAFEQNYTMIQAYGVAIMLGVLTNIVVSDFVKRL